MRAWGIEAMHLQTLNYNRLMSEASRIARDHHNALSHEARPGHVLEFASLAVADYNRARAAYDAEPVTIRLIRIG